MQTAAATPRRIQRLRAVLARVGDPHPTTLSRWEEKGLFPKRVIIGPNMVGYYQDEIDQWIESRERQSATGKPSPNPRARKNETPAVSSGR
jgi:predicted DNA-binding transcriptional regulator AlpA